MKKCGIVFAVLLLLLSACGKQSQTKRYTAFDDSIESGKALALGEERDVYIFCDQEDWQKLQSILRPAIEREIKLVYPERYFALIRKDIKEFEDFKQYRNLIFAGHLEGEKGVSKHIQETLSADFIQRVEQSGGDLLVAKNFFSRDQIIMYILGTDADKLHKITALQSQNIFQLLIKRYRERLGYQAYQMPVIPAAFFEPYPFSLQIPNNYRLYSNDQAGNFLSLLYRARQENREIPDKYINIYYEEMPEDELSFEWLIARRQMLGEKYFEGDEIKPEELSRDEISFAGQNALRITGAWVNKKHLIGGAFQSQAFWQDGKAYIVDGSVYFPAGDKLPILQEIAVIAQTIKIK